MLFLFLECLAISLDLAHWVDLIGEEFGQSAKVANGLNALRALATTIASPLMGTLSDSIGRRPVMMLACIGGIIPLYFEAFIETFWLFVLGRILFGITRIGGLLANSYVGDITTTTEARSHGMSLNALAGNIGFILGVALGSYLGKAIGFRSVAQIGLLIEILNLSIVYFLLNEPTKNTETSKRASLLTTLKQLWSTPDVSLRHIVALHIILTLLATSSMSVIVEYGREQLAMEPRARAFLIIITVITATIFQILYPRCAALFGGHKNTLLISCITACVGNILIVLSSNNIIFNLLAALTVSFTLLPRSIVLSTISKHSGSGQGSIMGMHESIFNFGAVIGPLATIFLFSLHTYLPFAIFSTILVAGAYIVYPYPFPAEKKD